jgi:hypothetical protein
VTIRMAAIAVTNAIAGSAMLASAADAKEEIDAFVVCVGRGLLGRATRGGAVPAGHAGPSAAARPGPS